ncbi:triacylglycerol lipase OBL1, partial [Gossypium hirsutum]|uniref:Triacylglycerol lipase OBL1 n=1 Tax=Gossypium hirsutum TaxID=3635 RepID=A0ABM3AZI1_GOSHI
PLPFPPFFSPKSKTPSSPPPINHPTSGVRSSTTPPPGSSSTTLALLLFSTSLHFDSSATSEGTLIPDRNSAAFISCVGYIDKRKELDRNIKPRDGCKYYSALSMMASKVAYENKAYIETIVKDHWKISKEKPQLNSFFFAIKAMITILLLLPLGEQNHLMLMHGVQTSISLITRFPALDMSIARVASGMQKGRNQEQPLAYYHIRDKLKALLSETEKTKYIMTGHSLGGALAILFPAILLYHDEKLLLKRLEGVYTYGQPRVGDEEFCKFMENKLEEHKIPYFRFVYCNDMVPRLPYDDKEHWYKHFGTCLYYNRHYDGKFVHVLPNKNYFSVLHAVRMRINSVFELIRSFTIHYSKGPGYKEGWFLRVSRMIGLVILGVSAHSPQDYVNSTRLGSSDVFLPPEDM